MHRNRGRLLLPPLLALAAWWLTLPAGASELTLAPVLQSPVDLHQIVAREDGSVAALQAAALLVAGAPGTEPVAVARRAEGQSLVLGDDGAVYGVISHLHAAADFAPAGSFELRRLDGARLWSLDATDDVAFAISSNQRVVGLSLNINTAERNRFHFYDHGGRLLREQVVPFALGGHFCADGSIFFVPTGQHELHAFDADGRLRWSAAGVQLFATTPAGERVAALGDGRLRLLEEGREMAATPVDILVRRIAIAPDGLRIAIAGKQEARVFDAADLSWLWSVPAGRGDLNFTSIDIAAGGGPVALGLAEDAGPAVAPDQRHRRGEVRVLDGRGQPVHRVPLAFAAWNIFTPRVRFDASGAAITVTTRRAVYRALLP